MVSLALAVFSVAVPALGPKTLSPERDSNLCDTWWTKVPPRRPGEVAHLSFRTWTQWTVVDRGFFAVAARPEASISVWSLPAEV